MGKYSDWTRGEDEALLNIIGGTDIARAVLRGENKLIVELTQRPSIGEAVVDGGPYRTSAVGGSSAMYYCLLSDDEVVAWIMKYAQQPKKEARRFVSGERHKALAKGVAYEVKIFAEVQPGCLFKRDIPEMGPTWHDFKYLQLDLDFYDPPTEHCLISWIPVPLASSTNKNVYEQEALVVRTKVGLPVWCNISFGSVNHVAGFAIAHFKATGKDPFSGLMVRTDTYSAGGRRLLLGWDRGRLYYDSWYSFEARISVLAVFVVGVVRRSDARTFGPFVRHSVTR